MSETMSDHNAELWKQTQAARRDPRSTHELISQALSLDEEDPLQGEIVALLHFRATREVFEAARALCASPCACERSLGAWILGQLGIPDRAFPGASVKVLARMLPAETDRNVLHAICIALGYLEHPAAVPLLLSLKGHPDSLVRYGVAFGLAGKETPEAIQGLIELSADPSRGVRDWATFGLGSQTDLDTPQLRAALAARLNDPDLTTRGEAMVGLARRKDERVLGPLTEALRPDHFRRYDSCEDLVLEAAEELADPRLVPALRRLQRHCDERRLADVIECCREKA
jgi:HEAT repeat protein